MLIREVMTPSVESIRPESTIQEAAAKMKELDVGVLPVCEDDQLHGIVTDRDITLRATAEGAAPMLKLVRNVMTPEVVICHEDDTVEEAARIMSQRQIRRLVVLGHDGRIAGMVSLGDLAVKAEDNQITGETLESISEPFTPTESRHPTV